MGYKKLSNEEEKQLINEYREGIPVHALCKKYGYKTKKSIMDKIKKHYPDKYDQIIAEAQQNRKGYNYKLDKIDSEFDAYFVGLMLTDGYISKTSQIGIDLADEDCIAFLSESIGKPYSTYDKLYGKQKKSRHRLILNDIELVNNLARFGITRQKSLTLQGPQLLPEEEKFIPYIIRGIIDGDGAVNSTSYGAPQFRIYSASEGFANWIVDALTNKMYMIDIHKDFANNDYNGIWRITTADKGNLLKLIALSYNKPFGMSRKYNELRETFRDYNKDFFE